jgi:translation elongation factor EF-4
MKKIQQEIRDSNNNIIQLSCITCLQIKDISHFFRCKQRSSGYLSYCKECKKEERKKYYEKNKERFLKYTKEYIEANREKHRIREKNWRQRNKNKIKEKRKKRAKQFPSLKLKNTISRRILAILKKNKITKKDNTSKLLGTDIETAKKWIESQFTGEMSWENHGKIWHIDHIKPCCSFDLTDISQQYECFNYKNLRPLLKEENLRKASEDKKKSVNK